MLSKFHVYSQHDLAGLIEFMKTNVSKPNGLKDYFVMNIMKSLKEKLKDLRNLESDLSKAGIIADLPTLLKRIEVILNTKLTDKSWAFLTEYHDILITLVNEWLGDKLKDNSVELDSYLNEYAKNTIMKSWNDHKANSSNNPVVSIFECQLINCITSLSDVFSSPKCDEFKKFYVTELNNKKKRLIVEGLLIDWIHNRDSIPKISRAFDSRLKTVIIELYRSDKLVDYLKPIKDMIDNRNELCPAILHSKGNDDKDFRDSLDSSILESDYITVEMRRGIINDIMAEAIIRDTPILCNEYNNNIHRWIDFSVVLDCVVNAKYPLSNCLSEIIDSTLKLVKQSINLDDIGGLNLDLVVPDVCKAIRMIKDSSPFRRIANSEEEVHQLRNHVQMLTRKIDDLMQTKQTMSESNTQDDDNISSKDKSGELRFFNNNNNKQ